MSVLSWGKPRIEVTKSIGGEAPADAAWKDLPEIKEGTSKVTSAKGNKVEALQEGGEVVDVRYAKNKVTIECEVFLKKGEKYPIEEDEQGLILDDYALRLTPEDPDVEGFLFDCTTVSVEVSWSSADGTLLKYMFDVKKAKTGKAVKVYKAPKPTAGSGSTSAPSAGTTSSGTSGRASS